jgi:aspartyl-tRNA(Asn)/glutamyl-tRNA(Gln) amidotransferase subunit C
LPKSCLIRGAAVFFPVCGGERHELLFYILYISFSAFVCAREKQKATRRRFRMVTHEDVLKIARLSKLQIREDELEAFTKDMDEIINFANTINQAAVESSDFDHINRLENVFREDVVEPSLPSEEILRNAESQEDGYFLVKKRG